MWLASHLGTMGRTLSLLEFAVTGVHLNVAPLSQVVPRQISCLLPGARVSILGSSGVELQMSVGPSGISAPGPIESCSAR